MERGQEEQEENEATICTPLFSFTCEENTTKRDKTGEFPFLSSSFSSIFLSVCSLGVIGFYEQL